MNRLLHIALLLPGLFWGGCFPAPTTLRVIDGKTQKSRYVSPSAYEHYLRSELHLRKGDAQMALTELDNALAFDSESAYLHTRKASILFRLQRSEQAEQSLDSALSLVVDFPDALILRGDHALGEGRKPLAEASYRRCVASNPQFAPCYLRHAELLLDTERLQASRSVLERMSRLVPKNVDGLMRLGSVCMRQLDYDCAASAYDKALRGRTDFESLMRLAFIRKAQGKVAEALRPLREAFDRSDGSLEIAAHLLPLLDQSGDGRGGDDVLKVLLGAAKEASIKVKILSLGLRFKRAKWVKKELEARSSLSKTSSGRRLLAESLAELGQWPQAKALLEEELKGEQWVLAANKLVALMSKRGDRSQALALLRRLTKRDGKRAELVFPLTQLLSRSANHVEAVALAKAFYADRKGDADALFNFAIALEQAGRWQKAVKLVSGFSLKNPSNAAAYNFVGYLYADKRKKLAEAERLLMKALARSPTGSHIIDSLGWLAYRQGRLALARKRLEWAYALDTDQAEVAAHLAEVLATMKKLPRALKMYRQAFELSDQEKNKKEYQRRIDALEKMRVGKR